MFVLRVIERAVWSGIVAICVAAWSAPAQAQLTCLTIDRVDINGVTLFTPDTVGDWTAPHEGNCLGLSEFDQILETVTDAYIEAGYILSRAYLPEQDLSDGQLDIAVVEGTLSHIRINGEDQPRWSGQVFPGQIGKPVNLRDVEQGLDVIQEMPRWQAQMAFDSGEEPGESILDISAATSKRTEVKLTSNNQGNEATGQWITGLSLDTSNLLGINDTWEVGITRSLSPGPLSFGYDGDLNRSGYVRLEFPYGPNTFQFRRTWSDYGLTIPGTISPIPTNGDTAGYGFQWKRLAFRDQTVKSHLSLDLDVATNANYIQGAYIDASSRQTTSLKLTYSREAPLSGGQLTQSWSLDGGLKLFGAEDAGDQPVGAPDAQYVRALANVDYERNFKLGGQSFDWTSTFRGQYSNDRLYGAQQFSIGSVATVRGSRIALARGSTGWLWRNDMATALNEAAHPVFGTLEGYMGVDIGRVIPQSDLQVVGGTAMGQAIGIRATDGPFEFDLSYQRIFSTSDHLQKPDGEWMMSMGYTF